jgi:hypothetical protein
MRTTRKKAAVLVADMENPKKLRPLLGGGRTLLERATARNNVP